MSDDNYTFMIGDKKVSITITKQDVEEFIQGLLDREQERESEEKAPPSSYHKYLVDDGDDEEIIKEDLPEPREFDDLKEEDKQIILHKFANLIPNIKITDTHNITKGALYRIVEQARFPLKGGIKDAIALKEQGRTNKEISREINRPEEVVKELFSILIDFNG